MRELAGHKVNGVNDGLVVRVLDEPGSGGANHEYRIEQAVPPGIEGFPVNISFQNGPIKEAGVNGVTHEVLLSILIDRLEGFQRGPFACPENQEALGQLVAARDRLLTRTRARAARGVEGTMVA